MTHFERFRYFERFQIPEWLAAHADELDQQTESTCLSKSRVIKSSLIAAHFFNPKMLMCVHADKNKIIYSTTE